MALVAITTATTGSAVVLMMWSTSLATDCQPPRLRLPFLSTVSTFQQGFSKGC